jgi:phage virion morphogenesis protein
MAGATIEIKVQDAEIRGMLQQLLARLGNLTPLMRDIGEILVERSMQSFATGTAPDGKPWKPSWRVGADGRPPLRTGGQTLILNEILKGSIHVRPGKDQVKVGTPVKYAAVHQFGAAKGSFGTVRANVKAHSRKTKKHGVQQVRAHTRRTALPWGDIPARPFLGVNQRDWNDIRSSIMRFIVSQ